MKFPAAAAAAALMALVAASAAADGTIRGKAIRQDVPAGNARVELWAGWEEGFRGTPSAATETAPDGSFSLTAPAGRYFVLLRKGAGGPEDAPAPGGLFTYYGGNPVTLADDAEVFVGINAAAVVEPAAPSAPGETGLRGRVVSGGRPLDRARVTLYQDGAAAFRGMGYASALTSGEGEFSFFLEPGSYWVVVRKRAADAGVGPLGAGDLFGFAAANPVEVREGQTAVVALEATAAHLRTREGGAEVLLDGSAGDAGETVVSGAVRDTAGTTLAGMYVGAYRDAGMMFKPDVVSAPTGADGSYALRLPGGGTWHLLTRQTLGGPPAPGELLGRYAGNERHAVEVKAGERVTGVDIVAEKVK